MIPSNVRYVTRPLAQVLRQCPNKVAVLEGARAVGKTMLVQTELPDGYHYETLADKRTFEYASSHLDEWVDSLPTPCIIDEAQRIPDLPLSVKGVIDKQTGSTPFFILTGSASITRDGLDGQDPLTRRSLRYTLYPLTRREINKNTDTSIIDLLWNGTPNANYHSETNRDTLARYMTVGGFPSYAMPSIPIAESDLRFSVKTDIDNVLGDTILPGERLDKAIADAILKELLAVPGGILNVKRISDTIHSNPSTIERYISIFMRRFLISALPNLRSAPGKQLFTRAKIHPVDTSFSVETIRQSGRDFHNDRVLFGELFESFAVNQIIPEIQWSDIHPDAFYWRETGNKPKEVDLVPLHDNQLVALEMKSNNTVDRKDFSGIAALRDSDKRFHRGYVLYTGDKVQQFTNNIWALPISSLWDSDGFQTATSDAEHYSLSVPSVLPIRPSDTDVAAHANAPTDANLFLSYCHADNDHLKGAILQFVNDIIDEYNYETSNTLGLFVDKTSINWGEDWRQALDRGIGNANIILPIITPRYVRSEACRKELLDFNTRVTEHGPNRILPLMLQSIDGMTGISDRDPVWDIAHNRQYLPVGDLRLMSAEDRQKRILEIVKELRAVIEDITARSQSDDTSESVVSKFKGDNTPDLLSAWNEIEKLTPQVNVGAQEFAVSFQNISKTLSTHPAPANGNASVYSSWAIQLSEQLRPDIDSLNKASDNLSELWNNAYAVMSQYVGFIQSLPQGALRNSQIDSMGTTFDGLRTSLSMPPEVTQMLPLIRMLGNFARPLRPFADAVNQSFNVIENMGTMTAALQNQLDRIPR